MSIKSRRIFVFKLENLAEVSSGIQSQPPQGSDIATSKTSVFYYQRAGDKICLTIPLHNGERDYRERVRSP
jgi:hypothetical protein